MSKKKHSDEHAEDVAADCQTTQDGTHPLLAEIESFLSRRKELSKKLAEEIEATERKLAELRSTAALLNVDQSDKGAKERKGKKAKSKKANRDEPADVPANETAADES